MSVTPMMQDEDLAHLGPVSRIQLPGSGLRADAPRNVARIFVQVSTLSANGCTIEGHLVRPGAPVRIEVYVDRLPHVLERVQTDEHRAVLAQATAAAERRNTLWRESPQVAPMLARMSADERETYLRFNGPGSGGPIQPAHVLNELGYRTGLPPLETCLVVHAQTGATMDARAWLALPRTEREEWVLDPPKTLDNEADRMTAVFAAAVANALGKKAK